MESRPVIRSVTPALPWQSKPERGCDLCGTKGRLIFTRALQWLCVACKDGQSYRPTGRPNDGV